MAVLHQPVSYALPASGAKPLAGVPPVLHRVAAYSLAGGTPYPRACSASRGSEFNQLAPQTPGWLHTPRLWLACQRWGCRSPPPLKSIARHRQDVAPVPVTSATPSFRPKN